MAGGHSKTIFKCAHPIEGEYVLHPLFYPKAELNTSNKWGILLDMH